MVSGKENGKTRAMWATARALNDLVPEQLLSFPDSEHRSPYIPLSTQAGKAQHKNAVSVHSAWVRFMVPDWEYEKLVTEAGFKAERFSKTKRLQVFGVTESKVTEHDDLFRSLVNIASVESRKRTTPVTRGK